MFSMAWHPLGHALATGSKASRRELQKKINLVENAWRGFGSRTDEFMQTIAEVSRTVGKHHSNAHREAPDEAKEAQGQESKAL